MVNIWVKVNQLLGRYPAIGDPVWWAPKEVKAVITAVSPSGGFVFQGGEIVRNAKGRELPRWTVAAAVNAYIWNDAGFWQVGQGRLPRKVGEQVVYPEPVAVSGKATGSFTVRRG